MKLFFEEYGLSTVLACAIMFLLVMASPIGASIRGGLNDSTTSLKDTGTEVQAKAGKSIKMLAGDFPKSIYVGYNSSTQTLVYANSNDSNSPKYLACDTKYGEVSNNTWSLACPPWYGIEGNIKNAIVENEIYPVKMDNLFSRLPYVTSLNLSNVNTIQCTSMQNVFNMRNIKNLDVSHFNTSKVTTMYQMFHSCENIESINIGNFNTSNVTSMSAMFGNCYKLQSINLSSWNTSKVTSMSDMFRSCKALQSANLSSLNTASLKSTGGMFNGCSALTSVNLSGWDTSNVTAMNGMFMSCSNLQTLDLSSFDTSNVTTMSYMFRSVPATINYGNHFTNDSLNDWSNMYQSATCNQVSWFSGLKKTTVKEYYTSLGAKTYTPDNSKYKLIYADAYGSGVPGSIELVHSDGTRESIKTKWAKLRAGDVVEYEVTLLKEGVSATMKRVDFTFVNK